MDQAPAEPGALRCRAQIVDAVIGADEAELVLPLVS
jgi:hypothetical protein